MSSLADVGVVLNLLRPAASELPFDVLGAIRAFTHVEAGPSISVSGDKCACHLTFDDKGLEETLLIPPARRLGRAGGRASRMA